MVWAIAILFIAAIILLILSFSNTKKTSKGLEEQIEDVSFTFMGEVTKLQQQLRDFEIDAEIIMQEAGIHAGTPEHRQKLREVLQLHRRGYSIDSIAMKTKLTSDEIEQLLTPYLKTKDEGGEVVNDI